MFSIDTDDATGTAPAKPAAGTPGFFRSKNPALGIVGTRLPAWWLNMLQAELLAVLTLAGISADKADDGQLADAIEAIALATGGGRVVLFRDEKTSGTDGGTFTAGGWVDRAVAEASDVWALGSVTGGVTIGLAPGTWEFEIAAPAYRCGAHQARLYSVTDEAVVVVGQSAISPTSDDALTVSHIAGVLTIAGPSWKSFKVQHRCGTTRATDGLGKACSFGIEVYTQAVFRRLSAA